MDFLENKHRLKNIFADSYGGLEARTDFIKLLERWRKIGLGGTSHTQNWDKIIWDTFRKYGVEPTDSFMASYIRPYLKDGSVLQGFALRNPPYQGWGMTAEDPLIIMRDYNLDGGGAPTEARPP